MAWHYFNLKFSDKAQADAMLKSGSSYIYADTDYVGKIRNVKIGAVPVTQIEDGIEYVYSNYHNAFFKLSDTTEISGWHVNLALQQDTLPPTLEPYRINPPLFPERIFAKKENGVI
jgi:hypothetical protein